MSELQVFTELLKETALNRYAALRALGMDKVRASGETHKLLASHFETFLKAMVRTLSSCE